MNKETLWKSIQPFLAGMTLVACIKGLMFGRWEWFYVVASFWFGTVLGRHVEANLKKKQETGLR